MSCAFKLRVTPRRCPLSQAEERWFTLGIAGEGKLLAVSHTYQPSKPTSAQVRIISAREATRREREIYENEPR